ncbi:AMP-binding protein, partial [Kitasatospora sp. NPDC018058]|uniref:non-ribosomal peptide synthetase n=1 Tax=Kitasatospora sp. NPDC018058 TaxID=3364025 RepID=UPI0037C0FBCD
IRLSGELDREALRAALNDVVGRHESLRTVFAEVDGVPRQLVLESVGLDLPVVSTSEAELEEALAAAAAGGFDLASDLPLRVTLFVLSPAEYVLSLVLHHIAADGWSFAPLSRDLAQAYAARVEGRAPGWEPLPVQYVDYTLWQQELLGGEEDPESLVSRQVDYWKSALEGIPDRLELPTDRPRPAVASHAGDVVPFTLSAELHRSATTLARETGSSVFMVLQAALAVLLKRLGAGPDIPLGTPIAGRTDQALDDVVGVFVNTLVLRTDVSGDPSFLEVLERVREADLAAYAHQDVPFEHLVEALKPARSLAHHPLFQVMLASEDMDSVRVELAGLTVGQHGVGTGTAKFDLSFAYSERRAADGSPAGIDCRLEYSTELFDRATAARMVEQLTRLLGEALSHTDRPVQALEILAPEEHHRILREWNDTACAAGRPGLTLTDLLEQQAVRTPERAALVFEGAEVSYAELHARADRLAALLTHQGAGPDRLVAVAVPRSIDMLVALLATLKSGAAYLPVDPDYPAERIAFMLDDADPVLLITVADTAAILPETREAELPRLLLDSDEVRWRLDGGVDDQGHADRAPRTAPLRRAHPAYVIYTSGSTGRPKGVPIPHEGIVNRLLWMQDQYGLTGEDRVLQKTPSSFDVSVWEFFWPLITGATLVIARPGGHQDPAYLVELIREQRVTTAHFVPSMLGAFLSQPEAAACVDLRHVMCSGEALTADLTRSFSAVLDASLHNLYGPTEASVDVTYQPCAPLSGDRTPPIGRPLWNTRVYVLDGGLSPVP